MKRTAGRGKVKVTSHGELKEIILSADAAQQKVNRKALGLASVQRYGEDSKFFGIIRFCRNLDSPWFVNRILKASIDCDEVFFRNLGKELAKKPVPPRSLASVEFFLATLWTCEIHTEEFLIQNPKLGLDVTPLCLLTDEAILKVLKMSGKLDFVTFDMVRKTRQRLGLKKRSFLLNIEIRGTKFRYVSARGGQR